MEAQAAPGPIFDPCQFIRISPVEPAGDGGECDTNPLAAGCPSSIAPSIGGEPELAIESTTELLLIDGGEVPASDGMGMMLMVLLVIGTSAYFLRRKAKN